MYSNFDTLFQKSQCGFRKDFNAQHCLVTLIEKWRMSVDGSGPVGALLMNLSKAFGYIDHQLLIAKLYAYGFDKNSLYFIHQYLKRQKQRAKINSSYSSFAEILFENIDIDIANYADDNTPYVFSSDLDSVVFKLQENTKRNFKWFQNNNLMSNTEKSHLIVSFKENLEIQFFTFSIRNEDSVKLWGIRIIIT